MFVKSFLLLTTLSLLVLSQPNLHNSKATYWTDATETYLPATAEWTNRAEVADINGDGMVDILFANGGNYSDPGDPEPCRVFLNQGAGRKFSEATGAIFGEDKFLSRVVKVRDINNDHIPDIILGTTYSTQSQLYIGEGGGEFRKATSDRFPQIKASIGDLEIGDADNDGDLDIALADWGPGSNMENQGGRTMLWLNDGKGYFTDATAAQMPEILVGFSWDLEFIDFDNDFDLDIAVSCKRCPGSRLFVNDGKGYFTENKRGLPAYTNNYELEPMDVNGDGFIDLVTVNDGEIVDRVSYLRREHIFINDQGKRFVDATHELWPDTENTGEDDNNVVFLDYDSDGDADFLLSSLTGEDRLLVNDGSGHFTLKQPVLDGAPTPQTLSLVLADLDGDHRLDIVMGQGEGEENIEERIFTGQNLPPDSAPPVIANYTIKVNASEGTITVRARIHDNKSPNMPQDWQSVYLQAPESKNDSIRLMWYGENLWVAEFDADMFKSPVNICATDRAGNKTYIKASSD